MAEKTEIGNISHFIKEWRGSKHMLKRGVTAICLLLCLGLIWFGAGSHSRTGTNAFAAGKSPEPNESQCGPEETIAQIFARQGSAVTVRKVDWGVEELPDRLWAGIEQWQADYADSPCAIMGYIELLDEPAGQVAEDCLWEYATIQHEFGQETFLVTGLGIYQVSSRGSNKIWQSCMEELLGSSSQWQLSTSETEGYIHGLDFEHYEMFSDPPYGKLELWYQGVSVTFYEGSRLLAYHRDREDSSSGERPDSGRECLRFRQKWGEQELDWQFCTTESLTGLPYQDLSRHFRTLFPGLWSCAFYTRETEEYDARPLIDLMTEDAEYVYYCRKGQWYQVCIRPTENVGGRQGLFSSKGYIFRYDLGYSDQESYSFQVTEQGDITETDQIQHRHYLEQELGPGLRLCFDCRMTDEYRGELFMDYTYEVAVSRPGEEDPFQILEVSSAEWKPFSFEDINADGWLDLRVLYYYGANGGTLSFYLWSPSKGEFVCGPEELGYFGLYGVDQEKRQLHMHYHGTAVSGEEELYQWSGETDCELIRRFNHNETNERREMHIEICCYEDGQEKILSDYCYPMDEYMERDAIWGIYTLDFVWEREVELPGQEGTCILRYAQERSFPEDEDAEETEGKQEMLDYLFLFRQDTYLICALEHQVAPAAYTGLTWDEEQAQLTVSYEGGEKQCYLWDGETFIIPPDTGI